MTIRRARDVRRIAAIVSSALALSISLGVSAAIGAIGGSSPRLAPAFSHIQVGPRPNVLVILTDDQRADATLRVMPRTRRWLKDKGLKFTNAYATTPLCCPSRASIFTGRYSHNHGVQGNREGENLDQASTLQRYLKEDGYINGYFGKYLNAWDLSVNPRYFRKWAIFSKGKTGYYDGPWNINGHTRTVSTYGTTFIRQRAFRFLDFTEERDKRPWMMFMSTAAPHPPYTVERRYKGASVPEWRGNPAVRESDKLDKPEYVRFSYTSRDLRETVARKQMRTLLSVDDMVGATADRLAQLNESRRTLVVYLSDNGFMWGEHGMLKKGAPYLQSARIPMLMRWPGKIAPGLDDRLVANIDIAPTILEATGVNPDPAYTIDGKSLIQPDARERLLLEYWELPEFDIPTWASIVTADRQYTEYYDENDNPLFYEYYDLAADPFQLDNLLYTDYQDHYADAQAFGALLAGDKTCAGDSCP